MKALLALAVVVVPVGLLQAQPVLVEPPEFPSSFPGPNAVHPGAECFWLASGTIVPGDVDWVQITIPIGSAHTIVDVDFPEGSGSSAVLAWVVGGTTIFNIDDNNHARDDFCGLGSASEPVGSMTDSAVELVATPRDTVMNIAITGGEDPGFTGAHSQNFAYDLWVYVLPEPCTSDADCVDDIGCTIDTCNPSSGTCTNAPDDSLCDNGLFCDGVETCDASTGCQLGSPPRCDDGVDCTVDRCDAATDACVNTADHTFCDNGMFCNGQEICDQLNGCLPGTDPCPGQFCVEDGGTCVDCLSDADCDDGIFCNGPEKCDMDGLCQPGEPPCPPEQVCNPDTEQCEGGELRLTLDLKPGACPNRLKANGKGYFSAALVASGGFDASMIDVDTVRLARADGVGTTVAPHEGPPGPHSVLEDVATPGSGEPCECQALAGDGIMDLAMKFAGDDLLTGLRLDEAASDEVIEITATGSLLDGTSFAVTDCLVVQHPRRPGGKNSQRKGERSLR